MEGVFFSIFLYETRRISLDQNFIVCYILINLEILLMRFIWELSYRKYIPPYFLQLSTSEDWLCVADQIIITQ